MTIAAELLFLTAETGQSTMYNGELHTGPCSEEAGFPKGH